MYASGRVPADCQALEALKEPKWRRLAPYFENLRDDDLAYFTETDIMEATEPKDRLLMQLFIKEHLEPHLNQPNPFAGESAQFTTKSAWNHETGCLDLRGRVAPVMYCGLGGSARCSSRELAQLLQQLNVPPEAVRILDLSENFLGDFDAPYILEFLKTLPNCKYVNLSNNRLHGFFAESREAVDKALLGILQHSSVEFVNILGNPLASIDRKDLYEKIAEDEEQRKLLRKLIFIPLRWLASNNWHVLFVGPNKTETCAIVGKAHDQFYQNQLKTSVSVSSQPIKL
jgi:hypothetical protein